MTTAAHLFVALMVLDIVSFMGYLSYHYFVVGVDRRGGGC